MDDRRRLAEWQRSRTRVAAYALCVADGRILLTRIAPGYPAVGMWTLPGGGINFGEAPADAALRELTEETGLTGRVDSLAFVDSFVRAGPVDEGLDPEWHAIRIVYRVAVTGGELRDEVDESTDMAAWFGLDEVDEPPLVDLAQAAMRFLSGNLDSAK